MAKNKNDIQRHAFQLTINNPEEHGLTHKAIKKILIENFPTLIYFVIVDEIGQEGTYHTHVYVYCSSRVRWSKWKKFFPDAHIEDAKGSPEQNRAYLQKSGKWADTEKAETTVAGTYEEWGDLPVSKGDNPLMRELYHLVEDGYSTGEIVALNTDYIPYIDTIDRVRKMILTDKYKGTRRKELRVHYIFGESETGKTRYVMDKHGDANVFRVTDYERGSYDSYNCESVIVYDEFRSSMKISHMLDALDIYHLELPARYSNRIACYTTVYIISNWALEDQYKDIQISHPSTWKAFLRRIHDVSYFAKGGTVTTYNSVEEYFKARPYYHPAQISQEDFDKLFVLEQYSPDKNEFKQ